ncbi:hypothetical protein A7J71_18110 [Achromobacter insolitus]|uniref:tape measure protein n=1 Tax=Achromobacter insolitus TaxID=217204 RepID=UPI0007C7E6C8|nr:tape measure protein [Achromobacter insolitus]OAE52882.1 hypothetical protein A7J71_18110 [Achromobacter insolitus]OCZ50632.1 hypothetical protein A7P22_15230 [Achromobacter insolitus]
MALNVGTIYYEVESDTSKLVNSTGDVESSLDRMNRQFARTDKAANSAQFQMTKTASAVKGLGRESDQAAISMRGLTGVIAGLVTLQGARGLIDMAEAYGEMSERVRMATASASEYAMVQQRLLANANSTYRSLSESSEVYIRTADSLRALGYSTEGALDAVDSLSYLFVTNAASAQRADGAISAFTKSLNKGKVEADGWETLMAAVPSIVNDIAAASGRSAEEIRKMGVSGELTSRMLTEGLVQSLEKNRDAAAAMATNLKDAFRSFSNNLSVFLGEANNASGATGLLSSAIIKLGENIDTIVKLLTVAGAGALAKYIAQLTASALAQAKAALSARALAAEEVRLAQAQAQATAAAAGQAAANLRLGGSHAEAAAAATAHRAATDALTAAQARSAGVGATLLGLLGGPAGIVALVASAAAGVLLFGDNSKSAAPSVEQLAEAVDNLTQAQLDLRRVQVGDAIQQVEKEAREAAQSVAGLTKDIDALTAARERGANIGADGLSNANKTLVEQKASLEEVNTRLQKLYELQDKLNNQKPRERVSTAPSTPDADPEVAKRLKAMRDELELAKLTGEARVRLQAIQKLGANATAAERKEAEDLAAQIYALEQAQKRGTDTTKRSAEAAKENQKVIDGLATSLYEAGLAGEALAVAKAKASLNQFATPEEIANVEALAKAVYEASQYQPNRQLLGQVDPIAGEQMGFQTQIENLRKLNEAKLLEDQRYLDLKAQAETAHDERMRQLQEENFRRQSSWNDMLIGTVDRLGQAGTDALVGVATGATKGADAARALGQAILRDGVGSLVQMGVQYVKNLIMGKAAATVATAAGVAQATTLAAAWAPAAALASLASFGANSAPAMAGIASTVATTQGLALTGLGRQYGGPVAASKMYRINENGAPEVLNAANGQQFLLPNTRGEVVSSKDASASQQASRGVVVNLYENPDRAGQVERSQGPDGEDVINAFVADIRGGGRASQAIEGAYALRRRGT